MDANTVIAVFTAIAAVAALFAAWQTRSGVRAQLVETYLRRFGSKEMLNAMMTIDGWWADHKKSAADDFKQHRETDYGKVRAVDEARRAIAHYYSAIFVTHKTHPWFITDRLVRKIVTKDEARYLANRIEPLEQSVREGCDKVIFDYFLRLHGIERSAAGYSNPT